MPKQKSKIPAESLKNTRDAFGVTMMTSKHKEIRRIKREQQEPSIHGHKFWGSSYLLMDYLGNKKNRPKKGTKVLELGCGWGVAGIYCAKNFNAQVTGIDADDAVFPFLHAHADLNGVAIETKQQYFEKISSKQLAEYDLIIAADVCFWDELADTLYNLINRACKAGVEKIIIADPERAPFFELSERCIDKFYAELEPWSVDEPRRASGCLLIIENA